jgi:hypothetical protein
MMKVQLGLPSNSKLCFLLFSALLFRWDTCCCKYGGLINIFSSVESLTLFCLTFSYESMLETVIFARDQWLVPNGIIFPDKAVMYLAALEDGNVKRDRFDFWNDVYGFDMSPIKDIAVLEPVVDVIDAKAIVTNAVPILHLDILTCTKDDLEFTSKFKLQANRDDYIHGLVTYFGTCPVD